jgi:hypothetical protein
MELACCILTACSVVFITLPSEFGCEPDVLLLNLGFRANTNAKAAFKPAALACDYPAILGFTNEAAYLKLITPK